MTTVILKRKVTFLYCYHFPIFISPINTTRKLVTFCLLSSFVIKEIPFIKQAVIEIKEMIAQFATTRQQHERTLDLLARRSIDQEAERKRLSQSLT